MEKCCPGRRVTVHAEPPQARELFIRFFFYKQLQIKVGLEGQGDHGWGVTRFEGNVTLGSVLTFSHINSFVIFTSPTRDNAS